MAVSNRDRVGRVFETLAAGLRPWLDSELGARWPGKGDWFDAYAAAQGRDRRDVSPDDPHTQLNILKHYWEAVFRLVLGRSERTLVFELTEFRNQWAHNRQFTAEDTDRCLDSAVRLLTAIAAPEADLARKSRDELRRAQFEQEARKLASAGQRPASATAPVPGLAPWREVVTPHDDVATGRFQQAEFAADLDQVHRGEGAAEYLDPIEFFRRTYLTQGLRDLVVTAARRVSGSGGDPVVNLQTTFGGGKTHSLLALFHLFCGRPLGDFPPELQEVLRGAGVDSLPPVRRAVAVGTWLRAGEAVTKPDGTVVRTLWGQIAWELGGSDGYAYVANADATATNPGGAFRELLAAYSPCLVLIDEWVAYARQLYGRDDLCGGNFDTHFTFAQTLTEAARATPGALTVLSIPASAGRSPGADEDAGVSEVEAGGVGGRQALRRLKAAIGRVESSWQPASAEESFEIVRRRLFQPITDPESFTRRDATAAALANFYRTNAGEFPVECREPSYQKRIVAAYPIHPELFDRLYTEWSTLDRFQRTRGVLRLMAAVVHTLWIRDDRSPVILPAGVPLDNAIVSGELTRNLEGNWNPIIDTDIDGPASLPVRIDTAVPNIGRYSAARRVARTTFLGSAPLSRTPSRGIEVTRIRLGCVLPGESIATFGDALNRLSGQATYLYADGGRYWYGTQPGVTRLAVERAERYLVSGRDDLHVEIERRLREDRERGSFAGVHVAPSGAGDVDDRDEVRLVVLAPSDAHVPRSVETAGLALAQEIFAAKRSGSRDYRNMLVFVAADQRRLEELERAAAEFLAWRSIVEDAESSLELDPPQRRQATGKRDDADRAVGLRLIETYQCLLVPSQPAPTGPITWEERKADGGGALAVRASRRLLNEGMLYTTFAPTLLRMRLAAELTPLWADGHVEARKLWDAFARYVYLPRLVRDDVLFDCLRNGPANTAWEIDGFATADAYDEVGGRYRGLVMGRYGTGSASTLVVQPLLAKEQVEPPPPDPGTGPGSGPGSVPEPTPAQPADTRPVRFHGAIRLTPERVIKSFSEVAQEVITNLTSVEGAEVEVVVEIRATRSEGFGEATVRNVTENATTLGFEPGAGFESA